MFSKTHTSYSPWIIERANDKKKARLNCMDHFIKQIPYSDVPHEDVSLPERVFNPDYERKVLPEKLYVPQKH